MREQLAAAARNIPRWVWAFWLMAALAVPVWAHFDSRGWDIAIYATALRSVGAGHDPYTDATDLQKQHHAERVQAGLTGNDPNPPYSYVYSPLTLPVLRALQHVPGTPLLAAYLLLYLAGSIAAIAVGVSFAATAEMPALLYVAGVAVFFPGLLANGTVLGGNIAYILYGLVLTCAWLGWRRGMWWPFYAAVLLASCIKAPLLSLAVIAPLSAPRQWVRATATALAGVALFASQPALTPVLFRHYLEAVELQFSLNQDFGCSLPGLLSMALSRLGLPYAPASYFVYLACAVPVFLAMVMLSRRFLRGDFSLSLWAPVLLTGTILLNPRIMEYDVAPVTVPMALLLWRWARGQRLGKAGGVATGAVLLLLNAASLYNWQWRKAMDGPLMVLLFVAGCWELFQLSRSEATAAVEEQALQAQFASR